MHTLNHGGYILHPSLVARRPVCLLGKAFHDRRSLSSINGWETGLCPSFILQPPQFFVQLRC